MKRGLLRKAMDFNEHQAEEIQLDCTLKTTKLRWSWAKAGIGLWENFTARETIFFGIMTWQMQQRYSADAEELWHWIMYCIVGICFIFHKALNSLISRGNLNVNASLGAQVGLQKNKGDGVNQGQIGHRWG